MSTPQVFVRYSHANSAFMEMLVRDLTQAGAHVWVDRDGIRDGNIVDQMNEGLKQAEWLVLVQTPDAIASPYVKAEVNAALHRVLKGQMRGMVPVIAAPCPPPHVPPLWSSQQYYDATQDYRGALDGLLRVLGIDKAPPLVHPPTSDGAAWTPVDLMFLWATITQGARRALGEIALRPAGYPMSEVVQRLDCTGPTLGGYLRSVGFALRQFPRKADPLVRDWKKWEYRMDPTIAGIIQKLGQITKDH